MWQAIYKTAVKVTVAVGNTAGQIVPWYCSKCENWHQVSSRGGNLIQGHSCPICDQRDSRRKQQQQQLRQNQHRKELASKQKEIDQSRQRQRRKQKQCKAVKKQLQISQAKAKMLSTGQQMLSAIINEKMQLIGISVEQDCIKMNIFDETNIFSKQKLEEQKIPHTMYKQIVKEQNEHSFAMADKTQKTINVKIALAEQDDKEFKPNMLLNNDTVDKLLQLQMARQALNMKRKNKIRAQKET